MGSPRCTLNRWGQGTTGTSSSCNIPKSENAKEMEDNLKKMMAERNKINNLWTSSLSPINPNNSTKTDK